MKECDDLEAVTIKCSECEFEGLVRILSRERDLGDGYWMVWNLLARLKGEEQPFDNRGFGDDDD